MSKAVGVLISATVMVSMIVFGVIARADTKPPKTAEFTAYEATLDGDTQKIKSVFILRDNREKQEFILIKGYGMIFRSQDARKVGE